TAQKFSVVLPLHNEEGNLRELYSRLRAVFEELGSPYEIIFVDDASTDESFETLRDINANNPFVRVIRFKENCGESAGLAAGFEVARGEIVIAMDADLQCEPGEIPGLLEKLKDYDVVWGLRADRQDDMIRNLLSWGGNFVRRVLIGDAAADAGSPLRAMKKEVTQKVRLFKGMHRFYPTLCRMEGFRVIEIPITHYPRKHGLSKYNIRNRLFKYMVDLIAVKWMHSRYIDYEIIEELDERTS
ncbi:MAG: glycosyltransferase family 2 protein, partial [Candidatus Brocadiales bacterium]